MIDEKGIIHIPEEGPYLLDVGDIVAFPESGYLAQVTRVSEQGIRIEYTEWIGGTFTGGSRLISWEDVLAWPREDFRVYGDGYYVEAAADEVHRATDRKLREEERLMKEASGRVG